MATKRNTTPPTQSSGDIAYTVVKAGLSALPLVGGPAAELLSALIVPPLTKRRDEWVQAIAEGLQELEARVAGFTIDSLQDNEVFITAVMHATQSAIRNHHEEKREALRNAVLNVASGNAPDEDLQLMFLGFIDTLTSWHLRVLRFFQNPRGYIAAKGLQYPNLVAGAIAHALEHVFPELRGQRSFYDQVVKDLYDRGLTNTDGVHVMMTESGVYAKRTTDTGDLFVAFISSPL